MDNTSFAPGNNSINNSAPPPTPQYSLPEHKHFLNKKFAITFVILLLLGGSAYAGIWYWGNQQVANEVAPTFTPRASALPDSTADWKTYTNTKYGYSFKYPDKLLLSTLGENINLSHSIVFDNYDGGCDMKGSSELSKTLGDFNLSINIVSGEVKPPYVDGSYSAGILDGKWSYMGAEGCGQTKYYFPISNNRTLIVTKNEIQILSDVVALDVKEKVLAVPGVISSEYSKILLNKILSTFKFTDSVDTSTWKTYTGSELGISVQYPSDWIVEASSPENSLTPGVTIYSAKNPPSMEIIGESFAISIDTRTDIEQIRGLYNGSGRYQEQTITIGSQKAYQYKDMSTKTLVAYIPYKGKIYTINAAPFDNSIILKALSTFKFTQ